MVVNKSVYAVSTFLHKHPPKEQITNWNNNNKGPSQDFNIRILCPNGNIGSVIGKDGNTIQNMRKQTGASIKIDDVVLDNERVIVVSTTEFVNDRVSPTLELILQLQGNTSSDKDGTTLICTRMLVLSK